MPRAAGRAAGRQGSRQFLRVLQLSGWFAIRRRPLPRHGTFSARRVVCEEEMSLQRIRRSLCVGLLAAGFLACRADERTALGVAERFVDEHYVQINLQAAKPFCTALALKKIEEEQR